MEKNHSQTKANKLLIICGALFLSTLSASWMLSEKTLSNHECFVSITAREMLQSGDWIWPTCNGQPRLAKTPLSYWLVGGLAKITGRVDEFTSRLPSVIFAVLSIVSIIYFVNRWLSFRTAVISGAIWATSLTYIRYAHNARPEMALIFFITLCFLSFYSAATASSRRRQIIYMLIFWISLGLGNLAKGPAPLPRVIIPLFFYVALFRKWKTIPKLLPVIGPIIFLAIVLPWPLAIAQRLNWDLAVWKREFVDRFLGNYAPGDKAFYYYLPRLFLFIAPWSAFMPMALAGPFYKAWGKRQPAMQFLWLWFVADLAFLTICGGKRQHYMLPIIPPMTILIGILIEDMVFTRKAYTSEYARGVFKKHIIAIAVGVAALIIYIAKTRPGMLIEAIVIGITTLTTIAVVALLFAKGWRYCGCWTIFGGIIVVVMVCYASLLCPLDRNRYSRDFSKKIAEIIPQSEKLWAFQYISNRSVHYFGKTIPVINDKSKLYEHYKQGDWLVATAGHLQELLQDGRLRMVYYRKKAERRRQDDASGALFHKSAPAIKEKDLEGFRKGPNQPDSR